MRYVLFFFSDCQNVYQGAMYEAMESHVQSHKGHKVNQQLDGQSFASPHEKASEEHDDDARLDRADKRG